MPFSRARFSYPCDYDLKDNEDKFTLFCQRPGSSEQSLGQYRKVEMFQKKNLNTLAMCKYNIQTPGLLVFNVECV